jgi:hypothetical protein
VPPAVPWRSHRGAPWLSAGLLKLGDPLHLQKWESGERAPRLRHVWSIQDAELFGITAGNYGYLLRVLWATEHPVTRDGECALCPYCARSPSPEDAAR